MSLTGTLLGALVAFTMTTAIEGYLLLGRIREFLIYAKQLNSAGQRLLAQVPSKSAGRDETIDVEPITEPVPVVAAEPDDEWRERFTFKPSPRPRSDAA